MPGKPKPMLNRPRGKVSDLRKKFNPRTEEETNKPGGKDPRTIYRPKPQIPPERQMRTGGLSPKQKKIAAKAPPPDKIDGKDFAVLKAEKAKGRGMGLQDESVKPGKVIKARDSKFIERRKKLSDMSEFQKRRLKLKSKKIGGVMKARTGKMVPLKKDPTKPISSVAPKTSDALKKKKLPGRVGTALGVLSMLVPAGMAAAKQYKDYKSAKNRDKAKVKNKMVGGMAKKYNKGGDIEVKQLDPLGKRLSDVGMMGGVGKMNKYVLRNQKKVIQKIPNKNFKTATSSGKEQKKLAIKQQKNIENKMTRKGDEYKVFITRSKGGGADTGTRGEARSRVGVLANKLKRRGNRLTERDIDLAKRSIQIAKDKRAMQGYLPSDPMPKKMGGGMMQRPMGYTSGGKAKSKPASKKRKDEGPRDDTFDPVFNKPEGFKKDLALNRIDDAFSSKNIGDGKKITRRGAIKIVDAAADDKSLERSARKIFRDGFKSGGSIMARGCKLGRNKKTKLY